jgi:hypothetical protein
MAKAKAKPKKTTKKKPRSKSKSKTKKSKSPPPPKIDKKKEENKGGPVDEKGNPFPIDNPEGGDPICPGGYKIDYDFDPMNDPIDPPFRCIPALKDDSDGKDGNNNNDNKSDTPPVSNSSNELQTDDDMNGGSIRRKIKHKRTRKIKRKY